MRIIGYIFLGIAAIFFAVKTGFAIRGGRPLPRLFLHALLGLAVLAAVNLTGFLSGVHIPINGWSVGTAALFGVPAVCGQLLLQIIMR